ncbi:Transposase, Tnp1/En/Spm-like protein [Cynara cardunculus var. scolymus]|uniref:Transposase, Tnp1/En/Spm-like protein n=1 Tax=Cynara cardunculus var. scolymus TaxID=59895 RepID=A0A103YD99_CYNCS|nr:Transposase, Tnp1/En/Spm-like protein [Cynara cardunculus var. scolymus]
MDLMDHKILPKYLISKNSPNTQIRLRLAIATIIDRIRLRLAIIIENRIRLRSKHLNPENLKAWLFAIDSSALFEIRQALGANMDNSWMLLPRMTIEYQRFLEEFLGLMFSNECSSGQMLCPCIKYSNEAWVTQEEEQMLDLNFQLPEGSLDELGPNDVFLKVMGKDKHGSARMYGLGVRGSDIWGVLPSRSACYRENMLWKRAYKDVSNEVAELKAMCSHDINKSSSYHELQPLKVGDVVHLKSIINSTEIVARGRVKSLDPDELVGGEEIGPNWCEVHVLVAIRRRERLVRPYGLFITIEDAIGATITWPCPFTVIVHDGD